MDFALESWQDFVEDAELLWPAHWSEIALNKDKIKLEPDYAFYESMGDALHICTARVEGVLVGYYVFFIRPHPHYRSSLTAAADVLYISPEYREGLAGYRFLKWAFDSLAGRGVQRIVVNTKLHHDLGALFERLGFTEIERLYSKVL